MARFGNYSLSLQLPLVATACTLAAGLCLLWLATTASNYLQGEQEKRYGESLARQVAANVRDALQSGDLLAARATLERFLDSSLARGITIQDVEGAPIGSAGELGGGVEVDRHQALELVARGVDQATAGRRPRSVTDEVQRRLSLGFVGDAGCRPG